MTHLEFERRKRNLTQKALGAETRITTANICMIESGRSKPFPSHAKRLSNYFGIPIEKLLQEVE